MLMKNEIIIFTTEHGSLLIRLLIAHFASDFMLQNKYMVNNKKWLSKQMLIHIAIVFISTFVLSKIFLISIAIAISHWLVDSIKIQIAEKKKSWESRLFFFDQITHILVILTIWALYLNIFSKIHHIEGAIGNFLRWA